MQSQDLDSKTKSELQLIAKREGLRGYSKLSKADLINRLADHYLSIGIKSSNDFDEFLSSAVHKDKTLNPQKPKRDYKRTFSWLGAYLLGAWTFLQFVDWILGRYNISPYWTDILLWIFIGILPTFLIYIFNIDRINNFVFKRWEMLVIPTNIIVLAAAVFFIFRGSDLGATTTKVTFTNTNGQKETREVVKEEFKRNIPVFPFEYNGKDSLGRDYALVLHQFIAYDLDLFKEIGGISIDLPRKRIGVDPYSTTEKISKSKIYRSDVYIDGSAFIDSSIQKFVATLYLRNKKNGAIIDERIISGDDLFDLADLISQELPDALDISDAQKEDKINIGVKEVATDNLEAARHYAIAMTKGPKRIHLDRAIELDSTYVLAYLAKIMHLVNYSGGSLEAKEMVDAAMTYRKRLPPNLQVVVMIFKHWVYEEWSQAEALLKMHLQQDARSEEFNGLLWLLYINTNQIEKLVEHSSHIFKADPTSPNSSFMLGMASLIDGKPGDVITPLKRILLLDPQNINLLAFLKIAYMNAGRYEDAKDVLDKIVLIEPNQERSALPMYQAIEYIKSHDDYKKEIKKWSGIYRETRDEQILYISEIGGQIFSRVTSQPGSFMYANSDSTIYSYNPGTCAQKKGIFENGKLIKIKTTQSSINYNDFSYYYVRQDSLVWQGEEMIINKDYGSAVNLFERAVQRYPEQIYLKLMQEHSQYMLEVDHEWLKDEYGKAEGSYIGLTGDTPSTAELWVKSGVLYYGRPGLSRRALLPIGENKYINLNRYDSIYEVIISDEQTVKLRVYEFNHQLNEYKVVDDWGFEKEYLKG